jgi:hypothetical protein
VRSDEWAQYHEVQVIKGQSGKFGKRAGKVTVLIWGDLSSRQFFLLTTYVGTRG